MARRRDRANTRVVEEEKVDTNFDEGSFTRPAITDCNSISKCMGEETFGSKYGKMVPLVV